MPDGSLGILTSEPTPSTSLLISTTMLLTILFFRVLTITGDRIPSIGSPVVTIPNCQGLIRGFSSPAVRQLTPFLRTGDTTTIGSNPRFAYLSELLNTWKSVLLEEPLFYRYGSRRSSGTSAQQMVRTGVDSLLPGPTCPSSRDYLSKGKPVIPFLAPDPLILMSLLCESTFAVPGPLYVARGFALCLMESVTLVIRRHFSLLFVRLCVSCLLCFHVGVCLVSPWYHTSYVIKGLFICDIFMCPFFPVISPVCFFFVCPCSCDRFFSVLFAYFCIFQISSNPVFGTLVRTLRQTVPSKG